MDIIDYTNDIISIFVTDPMIILKTQCRIYDRPLNSSFLQEAPFGFFCD